MDSRIAGRQGRAKVALGWAVATLIVFVILWVNVFDRPQDPPAPKPVPPSERRNVRSCEELDDEFPQAELDCGPNYDPPAGADPPGRNVPPW
jgi:hypothetical protein